MLVEVLFLVPGLFAFGRRFVSTSKRDTIRSFHPPHFQHARRAWARVTAVRASEL